MNKKSIGILTYYWPPAGGSGVQRWLRFSNYLSDLGWDVHVFTFKNPKYPVLDKSTIKEVNPSIKVNTIKGFEFPNFLKRFSNEESIHHHHNGFGPNYAMNKVGLLRGKSVEKSFILMLRELFLFPDARKFLINPSYKFLKQYCVYAIFHEKMYYMDYTTNIYTSIHDYNDKLPITSK